MEQRVYNSSGLPFLKPLDTNIQELQERVNRKKASLIIIDGGIGEGKTTLVTHVLDYINSLNGLPLIDLGGEQLAMGGSDFMNKIRICYDKKMPCIGYDEAGDFSKRGSLTAFNAMLNRTFDTFRAFKCIVVLALPNFNVLDNSLMDKNIPRFLLHLEDRTNNQGNYDCFSLYRMCLLKARINKYKIKNYAFAKIHPNFKGHFLDLCPERSAQLDEICTKNKLSISQKNQMKLEGLMSIVDMSNKFSNTTRTINNWIKDLKLKPTSVIGGKNYYNQICVQRIEQTKARK